MRKKIFTKNDYANFDKEVLFELKKENKSQKVEFITETHTKLVNLFNEYMDSPERLEKGFHTVFTYKRLILKQLANACIERRAELLLQDKLLRGKTDDNGSSKEDYIDKTSPEEEDKDGNT